MPEAEILVNGYSVVYGQDLVSRMKSDGIPEGFTLEVVPEKVVFILDTMPSSDFDFRAGITPQQTVAKARAMALLVA